MLPLLLAATFALPAVGVAVVAHLRHWRKTCAPAPREEVEATHPAEAAQTEDQAEGGHRGVLSSARRLGAGVVLLAVVYHSRSAWRRPEPEVGRILTEDIKSDCTSAEQDGCCDPSISCGDEWKPVCGSLPMTPTWNQAGDIATNYNYNYTFRSQCEADKCNAVDVSEGACDLLQEQCSEGCPWDQPAECTYLRVDAKADQT